jgi:hypothetical protein
MEISTVLTTLENSFQYPVARRFSVLTGITITVCQKKKCGSSSSQKIYLQTHIKDI